MIISQFAGIQNVVAKRDIPDNALQDAVDVDITNFGAIVARPGRVLAKTVPIDTAYTTADGTTYVVSSGMLSRVLPDLSFVPLTPCTAKEFADYQSALFTLDGQMIMDSTVTNLNVPVPQQPSVVITGGSLRAGRYNILCTYTNADGLEGGTSLVVTVVLTEGQDILINPVDLPGYISNVYVTKAGGEVFFNQANGQVLQPVLINANPFPVGTHLEYYDGRLFVAQPLGDNTVIQFSKPLHYHLYGMDDGYFIIPGAVLNMRAARDGLVIGTDSEIHVYTDGAATRVATYGVVPGRSMVKLPDSSLLIHTVRGVCSALPFTPITETKTSLAMGQHCNTALMYSGGIQRYVAMHDGLGSPFNNAF